MAKKTTITDDLRAELIRLNSEGKTFREMGELVGRNYNTVAGWFNRGQIKVAKFDTRPNRSGHHR